MIFKLFSGEANGHKDEMVSDSLWKWNGPKDRRWLATELSRYGAML